MRAHRLGLAIGLGLCSGRVAAQGTCDHFLDDNCIDAYGNATFDFEPLFKEPPNFGFGFRVFFKEEISSSLSGKPIGYYGDVNEVKAWLAYDNDTLNIDRSANRGSTLAMLLTNATGSVSGGNNGCDGLLGTECAANLIDVLKWSLVVGGNHPIDFGTVRKFQQTPLTNLSCPTNIFEEYVSLIRHSGGLVSEYEPDIASRALPPPSGSASNPWGSELFWRPAEEQMTFAAIGIAARFPVPGPRAYEDVDLQLVCVRPTPVEGSDERIDVKAIPTNVPDDQSSGGGTRDGDGDAGSSLQVVWLLLGTLTLAAALLPAL